jgi:hypothetical protein
MNIILIILICVILLFGFVYTQFNELQKKITDTKNYLYVALKNNTENIENKIHNDISFCISKIKSHNSECIHQVRKMNSIASQHITTVSNYYTDSDDNNENNVADTHNILKYLSDYNESHINQNNNDFKIEINSFHEHNTNTNTTDKQKKINNIQNELNENSTTNSNKLVYEINNIDENNYIDNNIDNVSVNNIDNVTENICDNVSENVSDNVSENVSDNVSESISDNVSENVSDNVSENISKSMSENNSENVSESMSENNSKNISIGNTKSLSNNSKDSNNDDNKNIDYESITFGSKKEKNNGKIPKMYMKQNNDDNVSVQTNEIIDIKNLEGIDNYKLEYLKKMAKHYSIPLTCKDGVVRRNLNKTELYNKIKEQINNI